MPTSIPMIFYALIANASVGAMFLGGLVPAGLMALSLMIVIAGIARRRDFPRETRTTWSQTPAVLGRALPAIALPGILLGLIYSGVTTPTEAAAIAATYALLLALIVYRTLSLSQLLAVISDTVRATAMIALIMSGAFVFNYAVADEGVPQLIQSTLLQWNLSPTAFLFCVDLLMLLLAVVLDEVTILLVIVPLLVPIAQGLNINLIHFGIVVVLNMMVGLTLPPHGLLLFVMSGLTRTPLAEIFREMPPFILAMLAIVIAVTLVPDIALWLPRMAGLLN
jgi:tripartite ATP-independent transporter DctM subunit